MPQGFYKVFCIFTGNKVHDYGREEIYAGGYPGAGAGRGICVRQQSERNARRRGGPRRIREVRGRLGSGHRPSGTELRHTDHAGRRGDHQTLCERVHRLRTAASGTYILSHPYRLRHRRIPGRGDCPAVQGHRRYGKCNPAPDLRRHSVQIIPEVPGHSNQDQH